MNSNMVIAIRIYFGGVTGVSPMADLRMTDGTINTIEWTNVEQREKFLPLINGYTLVYDERPKREWSAWLN